MLSAGTGTGRAGEGDAATGVGGAGRPPTVAGAARRGTVVLGASRINCVLGRVVVDDVVDDVEAGRSTVVGVVVVEEDGVDVVDGAGRVVDGAADDVVCSAPWACA